MEVMSTQFFTLVLTFIGVLVIGAAKYYERKVSGSTEPWSDAKFGMFFIVAAGVMIVEYIYSGGMTFPADTIIESLMMFLNPIFLIFGAAYSTIIAGKVAKETLIKPTIASLSTKPAVSAPAGSTTETNWLAISVTPTYKAGKGVLPITFNIYGTQPQPDHPGIASIDIDFADGSPVQTVKLIGDHATADHIYTFIKTPEYTGHTFYPVFKCNGSDGSTYLFNAGERKSVEVYVESL